MVVISKPPIVWFVCDQKVRFWLRYMRISLPFQMNLKSLIKSISYSHHYAATRVMLILFISLNYITPIYYS